jgi:hypothetical protein
VDGWIIGPFLHSVARRFAAAARGPGAAPVEATRHRDDDETRLERAAGVAALEHREQQAAAGRQAQAKQEERAQQAAAVRARINQAAHGPARPSPGTGSPERSGLGKRRPLHDQFLDYAEDLRLNFTQVPSPPA